MDPTQKEYEEILEKFKEEIRRHPDDDFTQVIEILADKFRVRKNERKNGVVDTLLLNLYGQDTDSLKRDLTKIKVLGQSRIKRPAPDDLLPHLCEALSLRTKEERSDIIMECLWSWLCL